MGLQAASPSCRGNAAVRTERGREGEGGANVKYPNLDSLGQNVGTLCSVPTLFCSPKRFQNVNDLKRQKKFILFHWKPFVFLLFELLLLEVIAQLQTCPQATTCGLRPQLGSCLPAMQSF